MSGRVRRRRSVSFWIGCLVNRFLVLIRYVCDIGYFFCRIFCWGFYYGGVFRSDVDSMGGGFWVFLGFVVYRGVDFFVRVSYVVFYAGKVALVGLFFVRRFGVGDDLLRCL